MNAVRFRVAARLALGSALVLVAAGCGSGSGSGDGAADPSTATVPPAGERSMAVVSDSEITTEIVDDLDATDTWRVDYRHNVPGARIGELDAALDEALAVEPEVLVYSAGANDLLPLGVPGMLEELQQRVDRASAETCVVFAVPTVDLDTLGDAEADQAGTLIAAFDDVLADWGVRTVAYADIAAEMADEGTSFFAEGEVGSFHPGVAAYPRIAAALADVAATCP